MNTHKNSPGLTNDQIHIKDNATTLAKTLANGKQCQLYDNTLSINEKELEALFEQLVQDKHFGINALSSSDGIIHLDKPKLSHIQIQDDLYRLYLYRYHAIIEKF